MKRILPTIVISQFFCTSMWFAGNAVMADIARRFHIGPAYLAHLASAVQLGFITGTLVFAILGISDRFSSSRVFFVSAIIAALCNVAIVMNGIQFPALMTFRFLTGFFLAGIYPVGMKIAADHYQQGLGRSLGFLVGALVLGTAFPHLVRSFATALPWKYVIVSTSMLSLLGGAAMLALVPDGPYRKPGQKPNLGAFLKGFTNAHFRATSFGYFGHMWELYTFWVFVPVILTGYNAHYPGAGINVPLLSFCIIASGSIACVISGTISQRVGAKTTATVALSISCICCLLSPLLLMVGSKLVLFLFLFIWGMTVIADSPMFSTLVAQNAPAEIRGASITIVNCIGFSITIVSIQLINSLINAMNAAYVYMLLAIGPVLGLAVLFRDKKVRGKRL